MICRGVVGEGGRARGGVWVGRRMFYVVFCIWLLQFRLFGWHSAFSFVYSCLARFDAYRLWVYVCGCGERGRYLK